MKLIGIAGKARSGKDSIASHLVGHYNGHRYALADPLKEAIAIATGIPLDDFYNEDTKEVDNPFWGLSPRHFAQHFGTECMRQQFREDFWLKRAELEYMKVLAEKGLNHNGIHTRLRGADHSIFVIPDIRFENEVEWIRAMGGEMWHVIRPELGNGVIRDHVSEKGVEAANEDVVFFNTGTLEDLHELVDSRMKDLGFEKQNVAKTVIRSYPLRQESA